MPLVVPTLLLLFLRTSPRLKGDSPGLILFLTMRLLCLEVINECLFRCSNLEWHYLLPNLASLAVLRGLSAAEYPREACGA